MKKITIVLIAVLLGATTIYAQDFKKFRVGFGIGFAMPGGEGSKGGVLTALEPGFRINDKLLANLRGEMALVARGALDGASFTGDVAAIASISAIPQYYFMDTNFRPYAGAGIGYFMLAAAEGTTTGGGSVEVAAAANKAGGIVRAGFDAGHFNFNIDYNIIPTVTGVGGEEVKNSYAGFRIGFFVGGGRM